MLAGPVFVVLALIVLMVFLVVVVVVVVVVVLLVEVIVDFIFANRSNAKCNGGQKTSFLGVGWGVDGGGYF